MLDILTSVVPYLALSVLMYLALNVSYLLTLTLVLPAAGFLVRTFVVFHDCAHGSLLPSKRANRSVGRLSGCSCSRRSSAGATIMRSITQHRETSSAAASGTSSR